MKNAMKKLLSLTLVVMLLLSLVPFQASAATDAFGEMIFNEEFVEPTATTVSQETTAATEEVTSGGEGGSVVYGLPSGFEVNVNTVNIYFNVDGQVMKKVTTKVGAAFPSLPSGTDALSFYAKINGSAADKAFKCWTWEVDGATVNAANLKVGGDVYLEQEDHADVANPDAKGNDVGKMELVAVFEDVAPENMGTSVKLDPKGGKFAPGVSGSVKVVVGSDYPVAEFPTPTYSGYVFVGWFVKESAASQERCLVAADASVTVSADLDVRSATARPYAKWIKAPMTVTVKWYDFADGTAAGFDVNFDSNKYVNMAIPEGSKLSAATGTFPTDAEINWKKAENSEYKLVGWKFLETGKAFKPGTTAITSADANEACEVIIVPRLQRTVTLVAQHPEKSTLATQNITVEIGERIGELPAPASWAGYDNDSDSFTFIRWVDVSGEEIANRENLKDTSAHPKYYPSMSAAEDAHAGRYPAHFDAVWEKSQVVVLYFHTNGNTNNNSAHKAICYDIPASGSFDMNSLNLYKYFPDYGKYDDSVDIRDGWYDATGWANYSQGKPAATVCDVLWGIEDTRNLQELHIMLTDKGTDANKYNNNNSTADKTNPKTGDTIVTTVVVLGGSVAALAAAWFVSKKRIIR